MFEIFLHELRNNLFGGKSAVAFFVMLVAFLISLGMMSQVYQNRLENYQESLSLAANDLFYNKIVQWEAKNGDIESSDTVTYPMGKVRKPEPLLFFSRGMDTKMGQAVEFLSTFPIIDITFRPQQDANLLKILFTAPDLAFVVKVLVSLLAILFAYNIICEERESGTLKLLLAGGASRTSILVGKFLGGLTSIWLAFTAAFLVYILAITFLTPLALQGETPVRILLIFLTSLLHIAVFFGIGVLVSVFTRNSAPALILALFLWLVFVFVLPGLSSLIAQQFVSVDSQQKVARMKLEKAQQMEADYAKAHPNEDRANTAGYGQRSDAIRQKISDALQQIEEENTRRIEMQTQLTTNLARLSPVGSTVYLLSALSRDGIEDMELYQRDLQRIKTEWDKKITAAQKNLNLRDFLKSGWEAPDRAESLELLDFARTISFSELSLGETLASSWIDFVLLAVFAVAASSISLVRFMFYDPR
jgi:ABC-type transport system involved in multi-copper enzyme maturation permease subunit